MKPSGHMLVFTAVLLLASPIYAFYQPIQGRWLSRDPIGETEKPHLHAFVANSAIGYVDPLGLLFRRGDLLGFGGPVDRFLTRLTGADKVIRGIERVRAEATGTPDPGPPKRSCEETGGKLRSRRCCCGAQEYSPGESCCHSGSVASQDFGLCLANCIQLGDPVGASGKKISGGGVSIPKHWVGEPVAPGSDPYTTPYSYLSRVIRERPLPGQVGRVLKRVSGTTRPLRALGRAANVLFIAYGDYLAMLEVYCSYQCDRNPCLYQFLTPEEIQESKKKEGVLRFYGKKVPRD